MALAALSLGVQSNTGRHGQDSAARLINCYAEDAGEEGKVRYPIYASDGWADFAVLPGGAGVRAVIALDDAVMYAVAGRLLYRVDANGEADTVGGIVSDGPVTMARNRRAVPQIAIVCDGAYYIAVGSTLTQVNDPDLRPPNSVTSIDGYFVTLGDDGRMTSTSVDEGTEIDGLDFAKAEANPDGGVRIFTRNRDLIAFGKRSTEFWTNQGNEGFPFSRVSTINVGCFAAMSVADLLMTVGGSVVDTVAWAGSDQDGAYAGVFVLSGYAPQKISTLDVDRAIIAEPDKASITGFSWSALGHSFYCIAGSTFSKVFDGSTGFWHDRQSYGLDRWRPSCGTAFGGKLIFGDYETGKLYSSGPQYFDESGQPVVMTVQAPPSASFPAKTRWDAVHIDVIAGVGRNVTNLEDQNPRLMLSYSDDGVTWSAERMIEIGRLGQRTKRVVSRRFGVSPNARTWRVSMSADVVRGLMQVAVDATPLRVG